MGSPIVMAGELDIGRGQTRPVSMEALSGVAREWCEMHELRCTIYSPNARVGTGGLNAIGGLVEFLAKSGRDYLCTDFVPTWLMGARISTLNELSQQATFFSNNLVQQLATPAAHFVWDFPKPMLMGPGTPLSVMLRRPSITSMDPVSVYPDAFKCTFTLAGEKLDGPPKRRTREVPYITGFWPNPQFNPQYQSGQSYPDVNVGEQKLENPFLKTLYVDRVNARVVGQAGLDVQAGEVFTEGNLKLRLWDGLNREVYVKTNQVSQDNLTFPVPPLEAYEIEHLRSVKIRDSLEPRQYYRATMGRLLVSTTDENEDDTCVPQIALLGYRTENLP